MIATAVLATAFRQDSRPSPRVGRQTQAALAPLIDRFLASKMGHARFPGLVRPRWYCASRVVSVTRTRRRMAADVWALCEQAGLTARHRLGFGTGISEPMVVWLRRERGRLVAYSHWEPRDAPPDYLIDARGMFPDDVADYVLAHPRLGARGEAEIHRQARDALGLGARGG